MHVVLGIALDGEDVNGFRFVRVDVDDESEIGRQVAADFLPIVAGIVGAHDVPVLLHEENAGTLGVHRNVVDTMSDLCVLIGNILRSQAAVDRLPGVAAIVAAEGAGSGDCNPNSFRITGIENDGVQAHATCARLPLGTGAVTAEAGKFAPGFAAVGGAEDGGIFYAGVD